MLLYVIPIVKGTLYIVFEVKDINDNTFELNVK